MNEGNVTRQLYVEQKAERFKKKWRRLSSVRSIKEFILVLRKQKYIEIHRSIFEKNLFTKYHTKLSCVLGKQIYDEDLSAYGIDTHHSVKNA